ncbi:hypothetical protein WME94_33015 [Sorangium sp. So ce429]
MPRASRSRHGDAGDVAAAAPARFETVSIARGLAQRALGPGEGRAEQDGHLAIARGDAIEHLRNARALALDRVVRYGPER